MEWLKNNKVIAWIIGLVAAFLLFKQFKPRARRRKPRTVSYSSYRRRKSPAKRRTYTKGGKAKKPWQVKGSRAAKLRMARIRRLKQ